MLDIYKLNPKTITYGYLDNQILDYYDKNDCYPVCINLNRDQFEQFLDLCTIDCAISTLSFRGIAVWYCTEEEEKKENDRR